MDRENGPFQPVLPCAEPMAGPEFLCKKQNDKDERDDDMPDLQITHDVALADQIREMISCDRFRLVVQPVIDLQTGCIVGGEVLSRLEHPDLGLLFPDKFLPAVELAGLCPEFDLHIFQKSCALMGGLMEQGTQIQYLSCNFSRLTLSEPGAADQLCAIADAVGIPHDRVAVEITEREQDTDNDQFCENLIDLKKAGFRILVDDLGAGVTSVRDLWCYPVDVVKIDRSLLLAADNDQGRSDFRRLRDLAVDLGCMVLCEGVETEDQHRFVLDAGCQYCQGYLFYRPMECEQFFSLAAEKVAM